MRGHGNRAQEMFQLAGTESEGLEKMIPSEGNSPFPVSDSRSLPRVQTTRGMPGGPRANSYIARYVPAGLSQHPLRLRSLLFPISSANPILPLSVNLSSSIPTIQTCSDLPYRPILASLAHSAINLKLYLLHSKSLKIVNLHT